MPKESSSEWTYFIHYLRNTLGTLATLSDYYTPRPPDADQIKRLVAQIKRVTVQGQEYIGAFSEFTHPLEIRPQPLTMPDWLNALVAAHKVSSNPAIKCELSLPGSPFQINADPALLSRAINAFLDNVQDALPKGGQYFLTAALEAGQAVFRVRNHGDPLCASLMPDFGKPFLTLKPGRIGLGLGWARLVAQAHGGEFGCSNVSGGVEFWLKIPLQFGGKT